MFYPDHPKIYFPKFEELKHENYPRYRHYHWPVLGCVHL